MAFTPRHAIPAEIAAVTSTNVVSFAIPYFGQIAGSAVAGLMVAVFVRIYARAGGMAYRASAWDTFVSELVQERWVVDEKTTIIPPYGTAYFSEAANARSEVQSITTPESEN